MFGQSSRSVSTRCGAAPRLISILWSGSAQTVMDPEGPDISFSRSYCTCVMSWKSSTRRMP